MENELIGVSQNIRRVRQLINQVADTCLNTVVCGETGVGKELVVKLLHQKSCVNKGPLIKVNCAALPDTLLESEMFGHEQGAFTGAVRKMRGKFEQAKEGVIFLDEIGDMSLALQSKLLHALQDGEFVPLGSERSVKSNAWAIAATNRELEADLKAKKFRADLYYRICAVTIHIDPLRKRPEDIPPLISYYVEKYASQFSRNQPLSLSDETIDKLSLYHWPGNVRELQNVLRRIIVLGQGKENIDKIIDLPNKSSSNQNEPNFRNGLGLNGHRIDLTNFSLKQFKKQASDQVEKKVISYVLENTGWNRSKASKILKVSYKTLLARIQDLDLRPRDEFI
ncbi:MAG: sigma-54 dependent transcriptional regulator [Desulfobacterales bacterium]|jgi:transcriptional regulator with GAF, ATPase, and Fis domain